MPSAYVTMVAVPPSDRSASAGDTWACTATPSVDVEGTDVGAAVYTNERSATMELAVKLTLNASAAGPSVSVPLPAEVAASTRVAVLYVALPAGEIVGLETSFVTSRFWPPVATDVPSSVKLANTVTYEVW